MCSAEKEINMTFKYEMHIHTRQGSACARNTGAQMADYLKELGYTGAVITDHFFNGHTAVRRGLPWEQAVEDFCAGYEDARRRGEEIGLDVFFGFEYAYHGTEFLIYGLNKQWLLGNPQIMDMGLRDALAFMREEGGYAVHAHPFRDREYITKIRLLPELTDAVESHNCNNPAYVNRKAEAYAAEHGLPQIAGADIHDVGGYTAGIETYKRAHTVHELINVIQNGDYALIKGKLHA